MRIPPGRIEEAAMMWRQLNSTVGAVDQRFVAARPGATMQGTRTMTPVEERFNPRTLAVALPNTEDSNTDCGRVKGRSGLSPDPLGETSPNPANLIIRKALDRTQLASIY